MIDNNVIIEGTHGGKKADGGKTRYDLVEPEWLAQVAAILTHGANKYGERNWAKVEASRYYAALYRHIEALRMGETTDGETGMHHAAHAACSLMFLFYLMAGETTEPYTCQCNFCQPD